MLASHSASSSDAPWQRIDAESVHDGIPGSLCYGCVHPLSTAMYAPSAFPPDPLAASGRHVLRGQRRIFSLIPTLWQFQDVWRKAVLCRGSVAGTIRAPISAQVFGRCCLPLVPFFCISTKLVCCSTEKSVPASTAHFCLCQSLPTRAQDMPASFQPKPFGYCSRAGLFCAPALHLAWACLPLMPFSHLHHTFCWNRCNLLRSAAVFQRMP